MTLFFVFEKRKIFQKEKSQKEKREKKNENRMKLIQFEWSDSSSISSSLIWWKKKINNKMKSIEQIKYFKENEINYDHKISMISNHCLSMILYQFSSFFHSLINLTLKEK